MLYHMIKRLRRQLTFEEAIGTILDDAKALNGAEFGSLQLLVGDQLLIVDQRGFNAPFLITFRKVVREEGTACGRALRSGKTVLIEDVEQDEEFAPYASIAHLSGFRSVVTTPLVTSDRHTIGVVSTHFARAHRPTELEIEVFEQYCVGASDYLWDLRRERPLDHIAAEMNDRLYGVIDASTRPPEAERSATGEKQAPY